MPDGQVQWIDMAQELAHIVRRGREYVAPLSEVESKARVPGARVHFDIVRRDGVEGAAHVTLKRGTRSNKRHRRFGDLKGARQPGAKVKTTSTELLGVDVTTQPVRVANALVEAFADKDLDGAFSLYAPDAVVHGQTGDVSGRAHIRSLLDGTAPSGFSTDAVDVTGLDELIRIDWPAETRFGGGSPESAASASFLRIDHGHIVEQWDRVDPPGQEEAAEEEPETPPFVLVSDGPVRQPDLDYLQMRFDKLLETISEPIHFVRVKLSADERRGRPIAASATLDVNGHVLRAHLGSDTVTEAADSLTDRLRRQLEQLTDRERHRRTGLPAVPGQWHHGDLAAARPDYFERDPESRELVRHKSFAPEESTVEEALWDMNLLDYDFFLFSELSTGQDCLLARTDDGLELHRVDASIDVPVSEEIDVVVRTGAPPLEVSDAIDRLDLGAERFVFFRNATSNRGNVIYRRYDGHYGLITPPSPES